MEADGFGPNTLLLTQGGRDQGCIDDRTHGRDHAAVI